MYGGATWWIVFPLLGVSGEASGVVGCGYATSVAGAGVAVCMRLGVVPRLLRTQESREQLHDCDLHACVLEETFLFP